MNVLTRGARNAFRNSIRTASIVVILGISIGLALAMLVARQAVEDKIQSVKSSVGNTINITTAGMRGFIGGGEPLTGEQLEPIEDLSHVTKVDATLNEMLDSEGTDLESGIEAGSLGQRFSQRGGPTIMMAPKSGDEAQSTFTPPVIALGTTNPTDVLSTQGGGTFKLTDGEAFGADSSENVALVGKSLADKNDLKVGSTFTVYGQTITVKGIFDAGNKFSNNQLILPLKTLQTLTEQPGVVTSAVVTVDSLTNVEGVTTAVQDKLDGAADVTNGVEQADAVLDPLENIKSVATYSLIGAIIAGSIIILLTMIMIVRERRREIGVLKAIGASNVRVVGQFMTEAVTLTSLGAIVGIVIGVIASNPLTQMLVESSGGDDGGPSVSSSGPGGGKTLIGGVTNIKNNVTDITASVGWEIILYGLAAALIIALLGSLVASYFIAKVRPAEVMRTE